jgi:hypothetical protein
MTTQSHASGFATTKKTVFTPKAISIAIAAAMGLSTAPILFAQSNEAQLINRLEQLATELEKVKSELKSIKEKQDATPALVSASAASASNTLTSSSAATTLTAYGEIGYSRPRKDSSATQTDVGRFVTGFQHRFNERTKVVAELEVEHAVTSAEDKGEVAVEQVYVEHRINQNFGVRGGLFLIPLGLINQNHEPHTFYGVNRPTVETAIIPSTLREVGAQVFGEHENGISWSAGISTGFDLTKWDPLNGEAVESPLSTLHQEGQFAKSKNLSFFGAADWRGIPGLRVGAGFATGKVGHGSAGFAANGARTLLWDIHTQWTLGAWDFAAVYARGGITGAGDLNKTFAAAPYLVPKSFDGWYAQAAYKFRLPGEYKISPFIRFERVNTGRSFDGVNPALNVSSYDTESIWTAGLSFYIAPTVVIKADYQRFKIVNDNNRLNVGLGFSF